MTNTLLSATLMLLVAAAQARAEVQSKTVSYKHGETELKGYLAWDDAVDGRRPGVLVVHEWWGLNDYARSRADQLARLGYAAFALDMYGGGKVTKHPKEASEWAGQVRENVEGWRERALAGLEVLRKQPQVDPEHVAAIGYCFGGATVLQLAYAGTDLDAVVSFHGALPVPDEKQAKQIKAGILICHGAADTFVPEEQAQKVRAALDQAGTDWQMVYYGGARHSFTNPDAGEYGVEGIKYDENADRRSWQHMQILLVERFTRRR